VLRVLVVLLGPLLRRVMRPGMMGPGAMPGQGMPGGWGWGLAMGLGWLAMLAI
jgi:hypothetical protein